jgi:hypothetical protein
MDSLIILSRPTTLSMYYIMIIVMHGKFGLHNIKDSHSPIIFNCGHRNNIYYRMCKHVVLYQVLMVHWLRLSGGTVHIDFM